MQEYGKIITHKHPHLDEIFTLWMLRNFGQKEFPGIANAKVVYLKKGQTDFNSKSGWELEADGILAIGVLGGRFDEHSLFGQPAKAESCSHLVAKCLGLDSNSEITEMLNYIGRADNGRNNSASDLAYLVKLMYYQGDKEVFEIVDWAMFGLQVKHLALVKKLPHAFSGSNGWELGNFKLIIDQLLAMDEMEGDSDWFLQPGYDTLEREQTVFEKLTPDVFQRLAKVEEIKGPYGKIKLAVIETENPQIQKYARHKGITVLVQKNSRGNVQIYTRKQDNISMRDVVCMLRIAEQETEGKIIERDWRKLKSEGTVYQGDKWHFLGPYQMILNGSLSAPEKPVTKLSLERIVEIIKIALNPNLFWDEVKIICGNVGVCCSSRENPCPFYKWGLDRCKKVRDGKANNKMVERTPQATYQRL